MDMPGNGYEELAFDAVADAAEAILVLENAPLPLAVILPDGQVAFANRALRDFLGYLPAELAGVDVGSLIASDFVDDFAGHWQRLLAAEGVTPERTAHLRRRDGAFLAARVASLVVTDGDGTPRFVIARALAA
jgi:PAS domain S-box-containing protein